MPHHWLIDPASGARGLSGIFLACLLAMTTLSCASEGEDAAQASPAPPQEEALPNTLTDPEPAAGRRPLFDAASFAARRGLGRDSVPDSHWIVDNAASTVI